MTRPNILIAAAAFFGLCSIVFDQATYQSEKKVSLTEIAIATLADKERDYSLFNKNNARFTAQLDNFVRDGHALYEFYRVAAVAANKGETFDRDAMPCSAESFLRGQIIELRPLIAQSLNHPLTADLAAAEDLLWINENVSFLSNEIEPATCKGMTGEEFFEVIADIYFLSRMIDVAFISGQRSYEAAEEKNKLEAKKIDQERLLRFYLLAAISSSILSLIILLEFFKTVMNRRTSVKV